MIGEVTDDGRFSYGNCVIGLDEAESAWKGTLEQVFATSSGAEDTDDWTLSVKESEDGKLQEDGCFHASRVHICATQDCTAYRVYSGIPGDEL